MPLTRGDKTIILGAVALAVTVVLGLAILKKPSLFTSGSAPRPADIPPPPTAVQPAPAVAPQAQPPVSASPSQAVPAAAPAPAPSPATPPAAAPAAEPKAAPPPAVVGDETLEKMFAEIAGDAVAPGKPAGPKAAGQHGPAGNASGEPAPAAAPTAATTPEPQAVPETPSGAVPAEPLPAKPEPKGKAARNAAKAEAKAKGKPAPAVAPEAKPAPAPEAAPAAAPAPKAPAVPKGATAKPKAGAVAGNVVRIVAEEKPGEYVLVIQTNAAPATFNRMFMTDPPRLVLDIGGAWNYNGPLSSATGNDFIRRIRVGRHADMFRVVLDMAPDATSRLRGAPTAERVPEGVALRIPK